LAEIAYAGGALGRMFTFSKIGKDSRRCLLFIYSIHLNEITGCDERRVSLSELQRCRIFRGLPRDGGLRGLVGWMLVGPVDNNGCAGEAGVASGGCWT